MHRIELHQLANIGNRMIQYAFASHLCGLIAPCELVGGNIPEWNIKPIILDERVFDVEITINDFNFSGIEELQNRISPYKSAKIILTGFFQDIDLLPSKDKVSSIFPPSNVYNDVFGVGDLVINIRAGEILSGISWYPMMPVQFYKQLSDLTGLNPVFVGQIGPCEYVSRLRALFPAARFIQGNTPQDDFELVRSARNICISVSTFSWMAAWLSNASRIFYPMHGFLHPTLDDCYIENIAPTNLAPFGDNRYHFFLFPLSYGLKELAMLDHFDKHPGSWREIPAKQVKMIRQGAPFVSKPKTMSKVDSVWYAHSYPTAAWEISEGLYSSPDHHYSSIGRSRGYLPAPDITLAKMSNISRNKSATQSSHSIWSIGSSAVSDASNALNGLYNQEYAFHTDLEDFPWWRCDLGANYMLELIDIYNRRSTNKEIGMRIMPLLVETSIDDISYTLLARLDNKYESSIYENNRPIQVVVQPSASVRYVRLKIAGNMTHLHLTQVDIFGEICDV